MDDLAELCATPQCATLSLGYNCFGKRFIQRALHIDQPTHMFDYIGSSMWAIVKLLQSDFDGIDDEHAYRRLPTVGKRYMITHARYYLRFAHDFGHKEHRSGASAARIAECVQRYTRRAMRFRETLANCTTLVLLRFEERNIEKHANKEMCDAALERSEVEHIGAVRQILFSRYQNLRRITVVLFSHTADAYDTQLAKEQDIHVVPCASNKRHEIEWHTCPQQLASVVKKHIPKGAFGTDTAPPNSCDK